MDLAAVLAQHVHALQGTGRPEVQERDEGLTELSRDLDRLVRTVSGQVAPCLSVCVVLTSASGSVTLSGGPGARGSSGRGPTPVLASLALSLPPPAVGLAALLVLQAADADAFRLLADDLGGRLGRSAVRLDQHLDLQVDTTGHVLAGQLADLRVVDQAAGALLEQGRVAEDAHAWLRELAGAGHTDVPEAARRLLAGLRAGGRPRERRTLGGLSTSRPGPDLPPPLRVLSSRAHCRAAR